MWAHIAWYANTQCGNGGGTQFAPSTAFVEECDNGMLSKHKTKT